MTWKQMNAGIGLNNQIKFMSEVKWNEKQQRTAYTKLWIRMDGR